MGRLQHPVGMVLAYDNSHDHHHRHFMGKQEPFKFTGYEAMTARFDGEVRDLWRKEEEKRNKDGGMGHLGIWNG